MGMGMKGTLNTVDLFGKGVYVKIINVSVVVVCLGVVYRNYSPVFSSLDNICM
jgi:hypothetical protein